MTRTRNILGLIAAVIIILSSAAHSLLGWKALDAQLAAAGASADLIGGLRIGWQFGGAAMLTFGAMALMIFFHRLRGDMVLTFPAFLIGLLYVAFGAGAMVVSGFDPFFAGVFLVPGALLLFAAWPR
jgi:hypothetical protein